MKRNMLLMVLLVYCLFVDAQWKPVGTQIKTVWTDDVNPENVLPEYPRPIQERKEWKNLNGLWDYAILPENSPAPSQFDGKILVPFAIESSLSGVQKKLGPDNTLWYKRSFSIPAEWNKKRILLHFGAVDWKTEVWVNGVRVGEHIGGFDPFYFDVTDALEKGKNNTLCAPVLAA